MDNGKPDPIADAIAATEPAIEMMSLNVTISSTGRPAQLVLPADASDAEMMELTAWLLTAVAQTIRARRESRGGLVVVRGTVPH